MKKSVLYLSAVLLSAAVSAPAEPSVSAEKLREYTTCDINNDGQINIADYCLLLSEILSGSSVSKAADVNRDGSVTAADAFALKYYLIGLLDLF